MTEERNETDDNGVNYDRNKPKTDLKHKEVKAEPNMIVKAIWDGIPPSHLQSLNFTKEEKTLFDFSPKYTPNINFSVHTEFCWLGKLNIFTFFIHISSGIFYLNVWKKDETIENSEDLLVSAECIVNSDVVNVMYGRTPYPYNFCTMKQKDMDPVKFARIFREWST